MNWRYFISDQTNVYNNIATEKAFFDTCEEGLLMLWVNDSCAIIGRNQNIYSEINFPFAETHSIAVARRFPEEEQYTTTPETSTTHSSHRAKNTT